MKTKIRIVGGLFLLVVIVLGIFVFWASSPTLNKNNYKKEIVNKEYIQSVSDSVFSIVTYNIGYLSGMTNNRAVERSISFVKENEKKVLSHLKNINPDIIAFQEIDYNSDRSYNTNQQNKIAEYLKYPFIAQAVNWDKHYVPFPYFPFSRHFKKVVSGQSILSRFPLKNHQRTELKRVKSPFWRDVFYIDRLLQTVIVTISNIEVVVMNVHLEAFDAFTRSIQTDFIVKKFKEYAQKYPVILLGDFNSDPAYKNASIFKLLNLKNVGCADFTKEKYPFTFETGNPFERLDYIFYTEKSIHNLKARVLLEFGEISDHFPVLMKFSLKNM